MFLGWGNYKLTQVKKKLIHVSEILSCFLLCLVGLDQCHFKIFTDCIMHKQENLFGRNLPKVLSHCVRQVVIEM